MTMTSDRYFVTYTTTTGYSRERCCDLPDTAEQLATHLLGCAVGDGHTDHGIIATTTITHQGQIIGEFEY